MRAKSYGFGAVEVRGIQDTLRTDELPCFLPENRVESRNLLRDTGIEICDVGTSVCFHDAAGIAGALEESYAALASCVAMGIRAIRVFGDVLSTGETRETVIRRVIDGIGRLCDFSEKYGGVLILLEIHGDFNTVEALAPIMEALGSHPCFGIIWDIEHSYRSYGEKYETFYELIRPAIRHVHVKDCVISGENLAVKLPGEGAVNISDVVARLERDGYEGYYSFEWEKRWCPEIEGPEIAFPHYVAFMTRVLEGL